MEGKVDTMARWCQSARLGPGKSSMPAWGVGKTQTGMGRGAPSTRRGLGGS